MKHNSNLMEVKMPPGELDKWRDLVRLPQRTEADIQFVTGSAKEAKPFTHLLSDDGVRGSINDLLEVPWFALQFRAAEYFKLLESSGPFPTRILFSTSRQQVDVVTGGRLVQATPAVAGAAFARVTPPVISSLPKAQSSWPAGFVALPRAVDELRTRLRQEAWPTGETVSLLTVTSFKIGSPTPPSRSSC